MATIVCKKTIAWRGTDVHTGERVTRALVAGRIYELTEEDAAALVKAGLAEYQRGRKKNSTKRRKSTKVVEVD